MKIMKYVTIVASVLVAALPSVSVANEVPVASDSASLVKEIIFTRDAEGNPTSGVAIYPVGYEGKSNYEQGSWEYS